MDELVDLGESREVYLENVADKVVTLPVDGGEPTDPLRSIYREMRTKPGYTDPPHCIYFYYIRVDTDGRLVVDHYFYPNVDPGDDPADPANWKPIPHDEAALKAIITRLAVNARPLGNPPRTRDPARDPIGHFTQVEWTHKSYIVFFIDEVNWRCHERLNGDAVIFIEKAGSQDWKPNWTFFDALQFDIDMPKRTGGTDQRTAIAFINHMKADDAGRDIGEDAAGNPLPGPWPMERQKFQFLICLEVLFDNGSSHMTVILDPGGTNLGPPVPPP